ncbi:MAG: hypothetical protein ACRC14_02940, partial [Paracoccaceae bacterium]
MNGWLKALLAIASLVVIGFGLLLAALLGGELWRDATRGIQTTDVVNVDPANETISTRLYLSGFERVGDSPVTRATLYVSQDFEVDGRFGSYDKSSSANAVNMLFVEPGAPDRWLFETNDQLITQSTPIALAPLADPTSQPEVATMLRMVTADTNADQRLSEADKRSLALMLPDGRRLVTLVEDVQGYPSVLPDPDAIVLVLDVPSGVDLLQIDPESLAILDR